MVFIKEFCGVKANLLYIREEDLNNQLNDEVISVLGNGSPLFIIVQLKTVNNGFQPMIVNLRAVRKTKLKRQVVSWLALHNIESAPTIGVVENISGISKINFDFSEIEKITLFCTNQKVKKVSDSIAKRNQDMEIEVVEYKWI